MRLARSLLCFALVTVPAAAAAQNQPSAAAVAEAREHFQRGVDFTDEGNYNAAMTEFLRAYELTRNPAVLYNISATHEASGRYVEALEAMQDYETRAPANVVAQRRAEVDAALARLRRRIGTVIVRVETPGLEVRIDGIQRRPEDVRAGLRVSAGRHRVSLLAPDHQGREQEIDVVGGETITLAEPLVPTRSSIAVDANIEGAEVVIDGHVFALTPVSSPIGVAEGSHHVIVRRAGYTTYETDVNSIGRGALVRANLAWASPMPADVAARVVVEVNEPGAVATLDGRRVPLDGAEPVPPGPHRLRVERRDYLPEEVAVNLTAGRSQAVRFFLEPTPAYRDEYMSMVRGRRVVAWTVTLSGVALLAGGAIWFGTNEGPYQDQNSAHEAALDAETRCQMSGSCTNLPELRQARLALEPDLDQRTAFRWVSAGIGAAGLVTTIIGVGLLLGVPPSDRFERRTSSLRLLGGPRWVGLELAF